MQVADLLHDLDDGMRPISVFFPHLPTPYHKKRDEARIRLGQIFAKVIEARRYAGALNCLVHLQQNGLDVQPSPAPGSCLGLISDQ